MEAYTTLGFPFSSTKSSVYAAPVAVDFNLSTVLGLLQVKQEYMSLDRKNVVSEAKTWIGTPYQEGGTKKGDNGGVDCSHLVHLVYGAVGCDYPYTPTAAFPPLGYFTQLDESEVEDGDVVLFSGHMGILVEEGDNDLISAQGSPSKKGVVRFGQSSWFGAAKGYYRWAR